jgi:hypothetical protein
VRQREPRRTADVHPAMATSLPSQAHFHLLCRSRRGAAQSDAPLTRNLGARHKGRGSRLRGDDSWARPLLLASGWPRGVVHSRSRLAALLASCRSGGVAGRRTGTKRLASDGRRSGAPRSVFVLTLRTRGVGRRTCIELRPSTIPPPDLGPLPPGFPDDVPYSQRPVPRA